MAITLDGTTGISSVDGSAASPSVRGADSNSGIVYAADAIKFSTGGTERFAITNTGFTGITQGITEFDMWRVSAAFTISNATITANWERADQTSFEKIGTGMSESSGIFTFPSTGKYLVNVSIASYESGGTRYHGGYLDISTDSGVNYNAQSSGLVNAYNSGNDTWAQNNFSSLIDVTNSSTTRMRIRLIGDSTISYAGDSSYQTTGFTCMKIGDT